ncbi:hypothetical protein GCM10022415_15490 [Knoellia locipacati]|uniref:Class F sortase n=1 Tax=Knoellia locipacati TaxID=882824 RepID=A0A512SZY5_9MICO|nr:class F sortase [Knoellia locipacati]GEQ13499.1 hypothetical protein KLO01_15460 [Knoellia locipacati]
MWSSGPGRAVVVVATALLAGVLAWGAYAVRSPDRLSDPADVTAALDPKPTTAGPTGSLSAAPSPTGRPSPSATASGGPRVTSPARPVTPSPTRESRPSTGDFELTIPSLDVRMPVVPVGVAKDGQMALPDDPDVAGWYRFGPAPTSPRGANVISAHVDSRDEVGPLAKLPRLDVGATIVVTVDGARVEYVVERVDQYAKKALDVDALFARSGPARLHLVSCGGEWNPRTRHYDDNVVAIARRASAA